MTVAESRLPKHDKAFGFYVEGKWVPAWRYIEKYAMIQSESGGIVNITLNESQVILYEEMAKMKEEGRPVRINDGKSRQVGGTTLISCLFFCLTAFVPGKSCGIVADTKEHGMGILEKYKTLYATTPEFLKSKLILATNNSSELSFDYGNGVKSTFKVVVQGDKAGRSAHYNYLHESEVAYWDDIAETMGALDSTVAFSDRDSIIVRETTSCGTNHWKYVFDIGLTGRGTYKSVFIPWYVKKEYRVPWKDHAVNDYENKLFAKGLEKEQVMWWRVMWENHGEDYRVMGREFPTTVSEMFLSTGFSFFPPEIVVDIKDACLGEQPLLVGDFAYDFRSSSDGRKFEMLSIKPCRAKNGKTKILVEPKAGHPYMLAVDPAKSGTDYWAGHIIDNSNFEQCATFHVEGRQIYEDEAVKQLFCLFEFYRLGGISESGAKKFKDMSNKMLLTYESNTASTIGGDFSKFGVRDIYINKDNYSLNSKATVNWGWRTTAVNRMAMLSELKMLIRDCPSCIHDYDTAVELETFQEVPNQTGIGTKPQAIKGSHDDLVMALAGAAYCRSDLTSVVCKFSEQNGGVDSTHLSAFMKKLDPFGFNAPKRTNGGYMDWRD